jgi:hypothetical protein
MMIFFFIFAALAGPFCFSEPANAEVVPHIPVPQVHVTVPKIHVSPPHVHVPTSHVGRPQMVPKIHVSPPHVHVPTPQTGRPQIATPHLHLPNARLPGKLLVVGHSTQKESAGSQQSNSTMKPADTASGSPTGSGWTYCNNGTCWIIVDPRYHPSPNGGFPTPCSNGACPDVHNPIPAVCISGCAGLPSAPTPSPVNSGPGPTPVNNPTAPPLGTAPTPAPTTVANVPAPPNGGYQVIGQPIAPTGSDSTPRISFPNLSSGLNNIVSTLSGRSNGLGDGISLPGSGNGTTEQSGDSTVSPGETSFSSDTTSPGNSDSGSSADGGGLTSGQRTGIIIGVIGGVAGVLTGGVAGIAIGLFGAGTEITLGLGGALSRH